MKATDFRKLLHDHTEPCATNVWSRQLNVCIDRQHWELIFNSTQETRLRVLHWKILHNIYPTNILLYKMGIANTNKCNVCAVDETDYIEHFYFACTKIKPVWRMVEQEISKRKCTRLEISETIALLGFLDNTHTTQEQKLINQLILMAKMCISKCRYANEPDIDIIFDKELAFLSHLLR